LIATNVIDEVSIGYPNQQMVISAEGAIAVVMVWQLDLQLHMQSVPITTNVASLNPVQVRCTRYNIM
jgi:hypothetical protein